jgi:hypothetical protein
MYLTGFTMTIPLFVYLINGYPHITGESSSAGRCSMNEEISKRNSLEQEGTNSNILVHSSSNLGFGKAIAKKVSNCNWLEVSCEAIVHKMKANTHKARLIFFIFAAKASL